MLQNRLYNGRFGCLVNLCCTLPVCIAGFAISDVELVNTLAFIFQLCIWLGEYYYMVIQINMDALLKQRPKGQPGTNDQNSGKIVIKVDGLQISNTMKQEIQKDLAELGGFLQQVQQEAQQNKQQAEMELKQHQQQQSEKEAQITS